MVAEQEVGLHLYDRLIYLKAESLVLLGATSSVLCTYVYDLSAGIGAWKRSRTSVPRSCPERQNFLCQ